jgi:hypothetical protein
MAYDEDDENDMNRDEPDDDYEDGDYDDDDDDDDDDSDDEEQAAAPTPPQNKRKVINVGKRKRSVIQVGEKKDSSIILDFRNKRTGVKATLVALYSKDSDAIIAKLVSGRDTRYIKINLQPVRKAVLSALSNQVGWSWGDVKRSARKLVRTVGNKKLLSKVGKIMNDPRFAKGMAMASTVFPPLGVTYGVVKASATLVDAASSGNASAIERIKKIKALAESGNLDALKTVRVMSTIHQAKKSGVDIGAWYSSIVAKNANPDRPNVINRTRGFYATGISAPKRVIDVKVF